jgi:tRNA pseudouridine55 synthase
VTVHRLELLGWDPERGRLELLVGCSAGTYIRSLARDLGERLGCGGALASLRRIEALGFGLEGAVGLEELDASPPPPLLDPLTALSHLPRHRLSPPQALDWRCGRRLEAAADHPPDGAVAVVGPDGRLAGIARADGAGGLQPKLVFEAAG